jgi:NAD(P)-dependent dehydrogenase (short-subunit alcohol dehydrogenase family)
MARMHSRKKGASRSRPPTTQKAPDWSDVSKEDQSTTWFRRLSESFGKVDILVNNAGIRGDAPRTGKT